MGAKFLITEKSANRKVGPIMVTTSPRASCPDACPLRRDNVGGCYAEQFPLTLFWSALDKGDAGDTVRASSKASGRLHSLAELCAAIEAQPPGALWRHNQAGDLIKTASGNICGRTLSRMVRANTGRRGFTYTHHSMLNAANRRHVARAVQAGFTVNLSANSLAHADNLAALAIAPVVVVLPHDARHNTTTPQGRKVVICPAVTRDDVSCATCQLCQRADRPCIVGFPAHGAGKKKIADSIAAVSDN